MQKSAFDINTIINDISLFDQAISASAANMKTIFDIQIAGISQTFVSTFQAIDATIATSAINFNLSFGTSAQMMTEQFNLAFTAIDTAALNSSVMLSTNFLASLALINAGLTTTQLFSDLSFSLMSANALTLFSAAVIGIAGVLFTLNEASAACFTSIEVSFSASLSNIVAVASENFTLINTLWAATSVLMMATTITNTTAMAAIMLDSFSLIVAGLSISSILINGILDEIKNKFEETAQSAITSFSTAQNSISESMNSIGIISTENTQKVSEGFFDVGESSSKVISHISGVISIINGLITLIGTIQALTGKSTALTVANTAANTANSTSQLMVISTTAGVGIAATGAAAGMLAFGGAVLMICAGIALVIVALALLFSILGKSANVDTNQLNELKNPKVDSISMNTGNFASGGFPSVGQMFIAREAGPELVGTIGGRSAVMNNNQIVESVSAGVYSAVKNAINSGGSGQVIQVFIGNEQLDEYIVSSQKRRMLQTNGIYA